MYERMSLQFFKYPDIPHWRHEDLVVLGEDEHGLWLGGEAGSEQQKGDGPISHTNHPWVFCMIRDAWWSLVYNESGHITHFLDIIMPAELKGGRIEMVDLDLDVVRKRDGEVYIDDEDEFLEHQKLYGYPDWVIDKARTTAADRYLAMTRLDEPFDTVCRYWYSRFTR